MIVLGSIYMPLAVLCTGCVHHRFGILNRFVVIAKGTIGLMHFVHHKIT